MIEGYVDAIQTQGAYRDSAIAEAILRRIKSYRPLNMRDLESDMLLLNDLSGVTVHAVMKPSENSPGHHYAARRYRPGTGLRRRSGVIQCHCG